MDLHFVLQGYALSAGLIVAIGAQNAHVLRMGLLRRHVALTVILCAASDALLIGLGIVGMGAFMAQWPRTLQVATWAAAAFLLAYGWRALRSATTGQGARIVEGAVAVSRRTAVLTVLAFTYLNPHTYLDTVVLIGSIGGRLTVSERFLFYIGCVLASVSWFLMLGYGARWLAPLFAKPLSWRILDAVIGVTMTALAVGLLHGQRAFGVV
ncbi:MAG TPA: LysE/ArgO family amino acid transporter [Accumulibacter sp.]|jgi:L-lysine exporter family protein LysE/ArgO|nr:LysE/ArgO family amino acid transporter [Accumulibacter sp.]HQC80522.1 LysE/ArgO family amino acid transporter [Accumulibacter sp.]